jgi:hypothetical protein
MKMMMIKSKDSIITSTSKVVNSRRLICSLCLSHSHTMMTQAKGKERSSTTLLWKNNQVEYNTRRSSHIRMMM